MSAAGRAPTFQMDKSLTSKLLLFRKLTGGLAVPTQRLNFVLVLIQWASHMVKAARNPIPLVAPAALSSW